MYSCIYIYIYIYICIRVFLPPPGEDTGGRGTPETPKPQTPNLKPRTRNQNPEIRYSKVGTRTPKLETRKTEPEIQNISRDTRNPKLQSPELETRNKNYKTRTWVGRLSRKTNTMVHEPAVERMWRMQDMQGQILASTFQERLLKPFKIFSRRSEACPAPEPLQGYLAQKEHHPRRTLR